MVVRANEPGGGYFRLFHKSVISADRSPEAVPLNSRQFGMPSLKMLTLSALEDDDHNMLIQAHWPRETKEFFAYIKHQATVVEQLVAYHLSLQPHQACTFPPQREWLAGSFNLCIPVRVANWRAERVMVRLPLPHIYTHSTYSAGEKLRAESATFAWLSKHCPDIPIPQLLGWGLPDGISFVPLAQSPVMRRAYEWFRRHWSRLVTGRDIWRPFVPHPNDLKLRTGYLIMEHIGPGRGKMLGSDCYHKQWFSQEVPRQKVFRSFARILVSLMRIPLPRIGSFTITATGELSLSSRPVTAALALLEAEDISNGFAPDTTYLTADSYVDDLLSYHDARMRCQPNAVNDFNDTAGQMSTIVILKALRSHFMDRSLREGPFYLHLTDCHESNIFVDDDLNITAIVDLEFACSLPIELQHPPLWLCGLEIDDFSPSDKRKEHEKAFGAACDEFLAILHEEQAAKTTKFAVDIVQIMENGLNKKLHWYLAAVTHPRVAYNQFIRHIQRLFAPEQLDEKCAEFQEIVPSYYTTDALALIERKILDKEKYDADLRAMFNETTNNKHESTSVTVTE